MVFYTGYLLGSTFTKIKMPKEPDSVPLQMSVSTPDSVLSRVFSERSLYNSDYVDYLDRDSPSGDSYRCALIIRKDIRLVSFPSTEFYFSFPSLEEKQSFILVGHFWHSSRSCTNKRTLISKNGYSKSR